MPWPETPSIRGFPNDCGLRPCSCRRADRLSPRVPSSSLRRKPGLVVLDLDKQVIAEAITRSTIFLGVFGVEREHATLQAERLDQFLAPAGIRCFFSSTIRWPSTIYRLPQRRIMCAAYRSLKASKLPRRVCRRWRSQPIRPRQAASKSPTHAAENAVSNAAGSTP